jgi:hypothetical protein
MQMVKAILQKAKKDEIYDNLTNQMNTPDTTGKSPNSGN